MATEPSFTGYPLDKLRAAAARSLFIYEPAVSWLDDKFLEVAVTIKGHLRNSLVFSLDYVRSSTLEELSRRVQETALSVGIPVLTWGPLELPAGFEPVLLEMGADTKALFDAEVAKADTAIARCILGKP